LFNRGGFPGSQPVSLDRDRIRLLQEKPYKVSWKADGTRYMMLIAGRDQVTISFLELCFTFTRSTLNLNKIIALMDLGLSICVY